jgi:hypothetical protein
MIIDLINYLLADASITAVVGARVTPSSTAQGTALPALTLHGVSGAPLYADDGEVGLNDDRVQIDCWAITYAEARDLSDLVKSRLSAAQDVSQGDTTFIYMLLDNYQDLREGGSNAAEYRYRVSLDFEIWWR